MRLFILALTSIAILPGQSLRDCKSLYIKPMPESLDRFISAQIVKWGEIQVVASEEKTDCVMTSNFRGDKLQSNAGDKQAAVDIVHRKSTAVLWADSAGSSWLFSNQQERLAKKLVGDLKKRFAKDRVE